MDLGWEKPDGMTEIPVRKAQFHFPSHQENRNRNLLQTLTLTLQAWDVEAHLNLMDRANIAKSVLSITSPGTYLAPGNPSLCRKITRETNIAISSISAAHPDRLSFFASLPLPDIEGSVAEIDFTLDHLGAKGFAILTNVNGVYLGEPQLDAVFQKLNERKAVVMIHPTTCRLHQDPASASTTGMTDELRAHEAVPIPQYPRPMLEFFFDTARAITHLILSKTVERNPDIQFIVPHCGSVLPAVVERFTSYSARVYGTNSTTTNDVRDMFKTRFFFDLAGFPFPDQIHGLLRFTDSSRLLYGTDFPFLPAAAVIDSAERNDREVEALFSVEEQEDIYLNNARQLLGL
jgi:predicted TIM-barrel fold metal-dependent hydrolase